MEEIQITRKFERDELERVIRGIGGSGYEAYLQIPTFSESLIIPYIAELRNLKMHNPLPTTMIYKNGEEEKKIRNTFQSRAFQTSNIPDNKELFLSQYGMIMLYENGDSFVSLDSAVVNDLNDEYKINVDRLSRGKNPVFTSKEWDVELTLANIYVAVNSEFVKGKYGGNIFLAFEAGEIVGASNDSETFKDKTVDNPNIFVFRSPYGVEK